MTNKDKVKQIQERLEETLKDNFKFGKLRESEYFNDVPEDEQDERGYHEYTSDTLEDSDSANEAYENGYSTALFDVLEVLNEKK